VFATAAALRSPSLEMAFVTAGAVGMFGQAGRADARSHRANVVWRPGRPPRKHSLRYMKFRTPPLEIEILKRFKVYHLWSSRNE